MPIVGLNPSKADVNATVGDIARGFFLQMRRAKHFMYYLNGVLDADLTALGFDATEIANLRSAADALDRTRQIWEGAPKATPTEDLRTFPRRVAGLGDV